MSTPDPGSGHDARFQTTRWGLVDAARGEDSPEARRAMAELCSSYWYPIYAYVRRSGHPADEALDLTQGFFASWLARDPLGPVDPGRGRFRSYLLACCQHHLANHLARERAAKRGGDRPPLPIDLRDAEGRYAREPSHEMTPERLFERRWALALLEQVLARLGDEMRGKGQGPLFDRLGPALLGTGDSAPHAQIAGELGLTGGAVRVAAHRMRRRYRELLVEEVGRTVADPGSVADEISDLFAALSR
jgi:DNA-directed RNA polymerase specialized sigma24 family protein